MNSSSTELPCQPGRSGDEQSQQQTKEDDPHGCPERQAIPLDGEDGEAYVSPVAEPGRYLLLQIGGRCHVPDVTPIRVHNLNVIPSIAKPREDECPTIRGPARIVTVTLADRQTARGSSRNRHRIDIVIPCSVRGEGQGTSIGRPVGSVPPIGARDDVCPGAIRIHDPDMPGASLF